MDNAYHIRSLNLQSFIPDLQEVQSMQNEYQVYWWKNIPLGHSWIPAQTELNGESLLSYIWKSIQPALEFYCSTQDVVNMDELQSAWQQKSWNYFDECLERLFSVLLPDETKPVAEVSLVICTRNRTEALEKCLDSLQLLSVMPAEIIVVDNNPANDCTRDLVARFPHVRYVREDRKGLDIARNTGWQKAISPIVAYTDDDVRLHKDWILQIANAFDHPRVQAVTGLVLAEKLDTKAQIYFEKYWSFNRGYTDVYYDTEYFKKHLSGGVPAWDIGAGANMAFRRSALVATGGFDPRLDVGAAGCSGDSEMWYRLLAEGWTIHYSPRAVAHHTHRTEIPAFKKQIYYYLRGAAASLLIQHQRYRHRGNVYHLFRTLPSYYLMSIFLKFRHPRSHRYDTLLNEIGGWLAGINYFIRHRNPEESSAIPASLKKTEENPLISVVIPSYNHVQYLPDSIQSVLTQTYPHFEIIVIDDGSTDNTREIVSQFPQVRYFYQQNQGLSAARNTGVFQSRGSLILFLDADDWLYPQALAINLKAIQNHPDVAFVSGGHDRADEHRKLIKTYETNPPLEDYGRELLRGNYIGMHATVLYKREIFDMILFDETLPACEDYDLYLRIAAVYPVWSHNKRIAAYRIHGNNMSANPKFMLREVEKVLAKNKFSYRDTLSQKAYQEGRKNWKMYYAREAVRRLSYPHLYPGYHRTWKDVFFSFGILPKETLRFLYYKIKDKKKSLIKLDFITTGMNLKQIGMPHRRNGIPPLGKARLGDMRRTTPFSNDFGYDRGGPVDRYYVENFLEENKELIRGRVLEIGDNEYTIRFGGDRVSQSDILHINDANPAATFVGDLSRADFMEDELFDCIILTQTLQMIYDFQSAIKHAHRILKKGGILLLTVPGITQIDHGEWKDTWYWSFTGIAISRLLNDSFGPQNVQVQTHGNVLTAAAFLYGMGKDEITKAEKDDYDPHYQLIITGRAKKE